VRVVRIAQPSQERAAAALLVEPGSRTCGWISRGVEAVQCDVGSNSGTVLRLRRSALLSDRRMELLDDAPKHTLSSTR
jgi:hypothetical protein